jgi:hypothetical protein
VLAENVCNLGICQIKWPASVLQYPRFRLIQGLINDVTPVNVVPLVERLLFFRPIERLNCSVDLLHAGRSPQDAQLACRLSVRGPFERLASFQFIHAMAT